MRRAAAASYLKPMELKKLLQSSGPPCLLASALVGRFRLFTLPLFFSYKFYATLARCTPCRWQHSKNRCCCPHGWAGRAGSCSPSTSTQYRYTSPMTCSLNPTGPDAGWPASEGCLDFWPSFERQFHSLNPPPPTFCLTTTEWLGLQQNFEVAFEDNSRCVAMNRPAPALAAVLPVRIRGKVARALSLLNCNSDPMSKLALTFHRSPTSSLPQESTKPRAICADCLPTHSVCCSSPRAPVLLAATSCCHPRWCRLCVRWRVCVCTLPPHSSPPHHRSTLPCHRSHRATAAISRVVCSQHSVVKRESHPALARVVRVGAGRATSVVNLCSCAHC